MYRRINVSTYQQRMYQFMYSSINIRTIYVSANVYVDVCINTRISVCIDVDLLNVVLVLGILEYQIEGN